MLPRVPEPEVMDSPEEAREYDAMDHAEVNRAFVADFLEVWNRRGPILDVGTGTALIPIEFCRHCPEGDIVALDLSESMLGRARENLRRAGLEARVRLERGNARAMPFPDGCFPALMSNSIVHHIPEPRDVIAEFARVTAPGATLFVRDLLRPADEDTLRRLVDTHAAGANEHQRKMFADSLRAALTLDEVRAAVVAFGFDPLAVRQTSDRHWTWATTRH